MTTEHDPAKGIVDVDTFTYFIAGYVADIFENLPLKQKLFVTELEGLMLSGMVENLPKVLFENCPWDSVPDSIQEILALQYGSAKLPGEKTVDVRIRDESICFSLNSPSISGTLDLHDETFTGNGVFLWLTDDNKKVLRRGDWAMAKSTALGKIRLDEFGRKYSDTSQVSDREINETIGEVDALVTPASLTELQDVARLLTKCRDRASILRIIEVADDAN